MIEKSEKKVSDTARPILAVKYVTSQPSFWQEKGCGHRERPLIKGDFAALFLSEEDMKSALSHPNINNLKTVSVRDKYINQLYQRYIKHKGYEQVINLGSGFDVRAVKAAASSSSKNYEKYKKVKFWEIDEQEILDEKEKIFQQRGFDKNATYIKADYTTIDFVERLVDTGIDLQKPTLIIFEGNLMYLNEDQIKGVFNRIKSSFNAVVITFDYFPQKMIDVIVRYAAEGSNEKLWKTGIDDLKSFAEQTGFTLIEEPESIGALSIEYDVDDNPSEGANNYFVCALGSTL